jgi:hypothetical protein
LPFDALEISDTEAEATATTPVPEVAAVATEQTNPDTVRTPTKQSVPIIAGTMMKTPFKPPEPKMGGLIQVSYSEVNGVPGQEVSPKLIGTDWMVQQRLNQTKTSSFDPVHLALPRRAQHIEKSDL